MPEYSSPLLEQQFVAGFINRLRSLEEWSSTAVVLAWDDSGGWYDHVMPPTVNQSQTARDALTGTGLCGSNPAKVAGGYQARCGYGTRLPMLVNNGSAHHVPSIKLPRAQLMPLSRI